MIGLKFQSSFIISTPRIERIKFRFKFFLKSVLSLLEFCSCVYTDTIRARLIMCWERYNWCRAWIVLPLEFGTGWRKYRLSSGGSSIASMVARGATRRWYILRNCSCSCSRHQQKIRGYSRAPTGSAKRFVKDKKSTSLLFNVPINSSIFSFSVDEFVSKKYRSSLIFLTLFLFISFQASYT